MSAVFRELLKKLGSGQHTGQHLSREEAAEATRLMLTQVATPAQIGAFLMVHRLVRPVAAELAGMLDAYNELGPAILPDPARATAPLAPGQRPVMVFGIPYDGRSRTAPLSPAVVLLLAAAGVPVLLHGGDRLPTKYGLPLVELWQALGVDWRSAAPTLEAVAGHLQQHNIGFVYLPQHFPLAQALFELRAEIGKRPPLATLELIWSPYRGDSHRCCGFVHPPTEGVVRETFALHGIPQFTTIKGLEGSTDLPRDRPSILGLTDGGQFQRFLANAHRLGWGGKELPLDDPALLAADIEAALAGKPSDTSRAIVWNAGFYLWRAGLTPDLAAGWAEAQRLLTEGQGQAVLADLRD